MQATTVSMTITPTERQLRAQRVAAVRATAEALGFEVRSHFTVVRGDSYYTFGTLATAEWGIGALEKIRRLFGQETFEKVWELGFANSLTPGVKVDVAA